MKNVATFLALSVFILAPALAEAKSKTSLQQQAQPANAQKPKAFPAKIMDPTTGFLIWQVSHQPELMNVDYLKYYLGKPDNMMTPQTPGTKAYYWHDKIHRPICELHQVEKAGQVLQSQMIFNVYGNALALDDVQDVYGKGFKRYFDYDGHPTELYSFVPHTSLALSSPQNTFCVNKAIVTYAGGPLPTIHPDHMQLAHDAHAAKVQSHADAGNWHEALATARERVHEHPNDAEAHIALAQALKKTGNAHDAIGEYKYALALNKYNESVRQQAIDGLKGLHVLPKEFGEQKSEEMIAEKRKLKFVHKSQRLRTNGTEDPANVNTAPVPGTNQIY